jgi:hypothetical protein
MAHGSKRWIVTFDGHLKKSNDRTKKDYYRNLSKWQPLTPLRRVYGWKFGGKGDFCPQCKHNVKPILAHNDAYDAAVEKLKNEFEKKLQPEIEAFERKFAKWMAMEDYRWGMDMPRNPADDYSRFWKFKAQNEHRLPPKPMWDVETYLCPKHRRCSDVKDSMWSANLPGRKAHYQDMVRQDYRDYRNEVKKVMRNAKYDEDGYDDIPRYRRGWLD